MGMCCSLGRNDDRDVPCQGHHSVYIHPEDGFESHNCHVVYRPPDLNERLTPGESKPHFWINPTSSSPSEAIVSVAWCQFCHSQAVCPSRWPYPQRSSSKKTTHPQASSTFQHDTDTNMAEGSKDEVTKIDASSADNCMFIKIYPVFLAPFINKPIRIRLVFMDAKVVQLVGESGHLKHSRAPQSEPMLEIWHLVRNLHSLKLHFKYRAAVGGLPEISVEENHGGIKRLKRQRYRPMPVCWIDLDHRKPNVRVVGEQFELTLGPTCPSLGPEDFLDGNGEVPIVLGTYVRSLDTCPSRLLHFSARLYNWFNQSIPLEGLNHTSQQ